MGKGKTFKEFKKNIGNKVNKISKCNRNPKRTQRPDSQYRCKERSCYYCGEIDIEELTIAIRNRIEEHDLYNMVTITSNSRDPRVVKQLFDKMKRKINDIHNNPKKFKKKLFNMKICEKRDIWSNMKNPNSNKEETNIEYYAKQLIDALINDNLYYFMQKYTKDISKSKCTRASKKYNEVKNKEYYKGASYDELKKTGMLCKFYNDYDYFLNIIFNYNYSNDLSFNEKFNKQLKDQLNMFFQGKFKYILVFETTERNFFHIHLATNIYIPKYFLPATRCHQGYSSCAITDNNIGTFANGKEYHKDYRGAKQIAEYMTKKLDNEVNYLKLLENSYVNEGITDEDPVKSFNIISSSKNIILKNKTIKGKNTYKTEQVRNVRNKNKHYLKIEKLMIENKSLKDRFDHNEKLSDEETQKIQKVTEQIQEEIELFLNQQLTRLSTSTIKLNIKSQPKLQENLSNNQLDFINGILKEPEMIILTGGAGTGKTACITETINQLDFSNLESKMNVLVCAPTGKAKDHVRDLIRKYCPNKLDHIKIDTVHGAMFSLPTSKNLIPEFRYNEENPAKYDLVLVDEAGMVDTLMAANLLNGLKANCKVAFIGDSNQLKPVNGSSILDYNAKYNIIKTVHLSFNYRSTDGINKLAYTFKEGKYSKDCFKTVSENLDKKEELDELINLIKDGFVIICNTNRLVDKINRTTVLGFEIKGRNGYRYRIGMPVLFQKNDKRRGISNGKIAVLERYDDATEIFTFEGGIQATLDESINLFCPAFAFTCHKSQGSEFEKVVLLLDNEAKLLNKELAYTAITRAKKEVKLYKTDGVDERLLYV